MYKRKQLKDPDISGAIFTLSLSILIQFSMCRGRQRCQGFLIDPGYIREILWFISWCILNKISFRAITKTNTIFNRQMIFWRYQIQILITLQKISSLTRYYNRLAKHFPLHYCIYIISINKYSKKYVKFIWLRVLGQRLLLSNGMKLVFGKLIEKCFQWGKITRQ